MRQRNVIIGLAVLAVGVSGWYLFRPERLFLDDVVDEAFSGQEDQALTRGTFHSNAHETSGTATIYQLEGGRRVLRLADFETSNGPDVRVYLVAAADVSDNDTVEKAGFVELGLLKGNIGAQNYEVPAEVDLAKYRSVTIWCKRFSVNFGTAPLATL